MKKNLKNNIAQKGGLMIEALAMLGLIAVVTPTMYKKSAERTLEVEDINTADTIRSYMGATEAYMAANYRKLIKEMTENEDGTPKEDPDTVREVNWSDIQSYMPYGFQNDKSLYDYSTPKISIVLQGTNLTAFALFPAKAAGGLGQERTSRIASLIGANGGYTKADKSAHGIGGVWNLSSDDVKDVFGSNSNNEFSIVTASSNVINSTSGAGAVENTKYLQRTQENDGELWRNAMRTDLYMGGGDPDADPDDSENTGNHNILNINSLIVGAEKDMAHLGEEAVTGNNGLYLNPDGTNPNAYVGGTITALSDKVNGDKFIVGKDASGKGYVYFGKTTYSKPDGETKQYPFRIAESGKITTTGDIDLANANQSTVNKITTAIGSYGTTTDNIKINSTQASSLTNPHLVYGEVDKSGEKPYASVSILSEEMLKMTTDNKEIDNGMEKVGGTHVMIEQTGFRGADNVAGKNSSNADIEPKYNNTQTFPVVVGSNMMVKGVMSAGQVDAQNLRTASITTGSENIDDANKWLRVDKDGIRIRDINEDITTRSASNPNEFTTTGIYGEIKGETSDSSAGNIMFRTGNTSKDAALQLKRTKTVTENGTPNPDVSYTGEAELSGGKVTVRDNLIGMKMQGRDINIGKYQNSTIDATADNTDPYRVLVGKGGNVDMIGTNLKVMDEDEHNILTVKGNTREELVDDFGDNVYNDYSTFAENDDVDYNITAHGDVLFSSKSAKTAPEIESYADDDTVHYVAIGPNDEKAGVNVVKSHEDNAGVDDNSQRVLFVDLSKANADDNTYIDGSGSTDNLKLTSDKIQNEESTYDALTDKYEKDNLGTMKSGMVYVRKGLVDIVPDKNNVSTASELSANEGSGIIRASRFVANNINKDGELEKVPELINRNAPKYKDGGNSGKVDFFTLYNGDDAVRYDSYMVNPAYTSVMKDIKLTTRGGARLSDILPDFIAKGLYLANNTYDDTKQRMEFKLKNTVPLVLDDEPEETNPLATTGAGKFSKNNWASPYSGLVPAPQCPPGYGRVITINPFRFEMAQAGQLALSSDSGYEDVSANASGYYVNTLAMTKTLRRASYSHATKEKLQNELMAAQPLPRKVKVKWTEGVMNVSGVSGLNANGVDVVSTGNTSMNVTGASGMEAYSEIMQLNSSTQQGGQDIGYTEGTVPSSYVITVGEVEDPKTHTKSAGMRPLVFQQSTWFHTHAVPVVPAGQEPSGKNGTYVGYEPATTDQYIRGWAVLQGFLYHQSEYSNFACESGDCKELSPYNDSGDSGNSEILWNLFPVAKNSIGSYVNTYCYFDRQTYNNRMGLYFSYNPEAGDALIDRFDIMEEVPTSYQKGVTGGTNDELRKTYYENLNDPTMKYKELW